MVPCHWLAATHHLVLQGQLSAHLLTRVQSQLLPRVCLFCFYHEYVSCFFYEYVSCFFHEYVSCLFYEYVCCFFHEYVCCFHEYVSFPSSMSKLMSLASMSMSLTAAYFSMITLMVLQQSMSSKLTVWMFVHSYWKLVLNNNIKRLCCHCEPLHDMGHLYRKLAPNSQAMQWIETTLLANMGKLSKNTLWLRLGSTAIICQLYIIY